MKPYAYQYFPIAVVGMAMLWGTVTQAASHREARRQWQQFMDYWREGVWHIWMGIDHLVFLITLLLPVVLRREGLQWRPVATLRPALMNVLGIVTAFTFAHSVTLIISTMGWVTLPSRWVEAAIAATVVLVALNNLFPFVPVRRGAIALCLGLIHGFGFASVLGDLGLPGDALVLALVGFNIGVEAGQLAILAAFVPIAFALRSSWFYHHAVLMAGSVAIAVVASVWLLERSLEWPILF